MADDPAESASTLQRINNLRFNDLTAAEAVT
jgi:hypothetical protein